MECVKVASEYMSGPVVSLQNITFSAFLILVAESNFHIAAVYNICCILTEQEEDDYDVMQDPEFLQSVLENLPGVDPNNEAIRNAMGSLASQTGNKPDGKKDEEKKK